MAGVDRLQKDRPLPTALFPGALQGPTWGGKGHRSSAQRAPASFPGSASTCGSKRQKGRRAGFLEAQPSPFRPPDPHPWGRTPGSWGTRHSFQDKLSAKRSEIPRNTRLPGSGPALPHWERRGPPWPPGEAAGPAAEDAPSRPPARPLSQPGIAPPSPAPEPRVPEPTSSSLAPPRPAPTPGPVPGLRAQASGPRTRVAGKVGCASRALAPEPRRSGTSFAEPCLGSRPTGPRCTAERYCGARGSLWGPRGRRLP